MSFALLAPEQVLAASALRIGRGRAPGLDGVGQRQIDALARRGEGLRPLAACLSCIFGAHAGQSITHIIWLHFS